MRRSRRDAEARRTENGRGAATAWMPTPKSLLLESWLERDAAPVQRARLGQPYSAPSAPSAASA
jgi:hypothetical protein